MRLEAFPLRLLPRFERTKNVAACDLGEPPRKGVAYLERDTLDSVAQQLVVAAAAGSDGIIVLPLRDSPPDSTRLIEPLVRGSRRYGILRRGDFDRAIESNWAETVWTICQVVLHCTEDNRRCFATDGVDLLAWALSALTQLGLGYELTYATLQYSLHVDIGMTPDTRLPLARGECAFVRGEQEKTLALLWEGSSWSPIVSGFVMAPGTA